MESLNNLQLSSTTKKIGSSSQELQNRVLAQLSEPFQGRPRPRNPLSKFTIPSSNPPPSCHNSPIPAYRTFGRESLPILSPEDRQKLNISPVTGMPYNIFPEADQTRTNSSKEDLKTRRCLLQKKTIHRSLEDLRNASSQRNQPLSPRSGKSIPLCSRDSIFQKQNPIQQKNGNQKLLQALPVSSQCQQTKMNTHVQTDNTISAKEENKTTTNISSCGPDGDFIRSCSNETNEKETEERDFRSISNENESLQKRIKEGKRKCTIYRIVNAFTLEALRRRSNQLTHMEQNLLQRREERAARIILHHLLLNSWRMTKGQVAAIAAENTQMHKTIDNQSLQLHVIRKMQAIEKEKTVPLLNEYNEVKKKYCQTIKENESIKEEYAKVLEEKRSLERHLRGLSDENSRLNIDLQMRLDKKEMQLRSMELDRFRAEKFARENEQLAKESEFARLQIKELTIQQNHWQEKAMSYESKCYELKLEMEAKEKAYERVLHEQRDVTKENEILTLSKSKLEKAVEEAQAKLVESTAQKQQLEESYNRCKEELEDLEDRVEYLQSALRQYKKENTEIKEKLYDCTLKNVKRRRVWGAALYFLVNPIETFKRLYFGPPEELHSSQVARLPATENGKNPGTRMDGG